MTLVLNAVVRSRDRGLREALSAATIALAILSRNARVAAYKPWDRLRAGLDLILDQRGAEVADVHGGASLLCRDYKGKEADKEVSRLDPDWCRGAQAPRCLAGGDHACNAADRLDPA